MLCIGGADADDSTSIDICLMLLFQPLISNPGPRRVRQL